MGFAWVRASRGHRGSRPAAGMLRPTWTGGATSSVDPRHPPGYSTPSDVDATLPRQSRNPSMTSSLIPFFRPRGIAVIGASRRPGTIGWQIVDNLVRHGFTGAVYPVNPSARAIHSFPAWRSVREIPGEVDLAIVVVSSDQVLDVVTECGERGLPAVVVISSGFRETGEAGAELERALVERVHSLGMRLVGPELHGGPEHRPRPFDECHLRPHDAPRRAHQLPQPVGCAGRHDPRLRRRIRCGDPPLRVGGKQARCERQRPPRVLGNGPGDAGRSDVPGNLRKPPPLHPHRATGGPEEAHHRREVRQDRWRVRAPRALIPEPSRGGIGPPTRCWPSAGCCAPIPSRSSSTSRWPSATCPFRREIAWRSSPTRAGRGSSLPTHARRRAWSWPNSPNRLARGSGRAFRPRPRSGTPST
jgi:predicted CoA-binding protein